MTTRFAFIGFRHPHIRDMYTRCANRPDVQIVAACEEDAATRDAMAGGDVAITHTSHQQMLAEVDCDVVAIGDYYSKRGELILAALAAGRHVMGDKPLCTSLAELDQIEALASRQGRIVSGMLDMRDGPVFLTLRRLVQEGEIGRVQAISFNGQHPLKFGVRPAWYFEPGLHGGTLNDIAIHAIDLIPWVTGQSWQTLNAARCWHAGPTGAEHFAGCAQAMLTLSDGAGVLGDVSYLSPDSFDYTLKIYWRFTFWGEGGYLECSYNGDVVQLFKNGEKEIRRVQLDPGQPGGYLDSLLQEINGQTDNLHLPSADVLRATRLGLTIQQAADNGLTNVALG